MRNLAYDRATLSWRFFPVLKNGTFFEGTCTTSPVLGLRPCQASRLRVRKLPKPRRSTLSPSRNASVMHLNRMLTMVSACLLVRWTLSATLAASSAFVMCPLHAFVRRTQKPLSGLWKVTRSTRAAETPWSASWGGYALCFGGASSASRVCTIWRRCGKWFSA